MISSFQKRAATVYRTANLEDCQDKKLCSHPLLSLNLSCPQISRAQTSETIWCRQEEKFMTQVFNIVRQRQTMASTMSMKLGTSDASSKTSALARLRSASVNSTFTAQILRADKLCSKRWWGKTTLLLWRTQQRTKRKWERCSTHRSQRFSSITTKSHHQLTKRFITWRVLSHRPIGTT